ncbi:MAG: hypothetical protein ACE5GI_05955 [Candidatus Aminicenantales bacterium]
MDLETITLTLCLPYVDEILLLREERNCGLYPSSIRAASSGGLRLRGLECWRPSQKKRIFQREKSGSIYLWLQHSSGTVQTPHCLAKNQPTTWAGENKKFNSIGSKIPCFDLLI